MSNSKLIIHITLASSHRPIAALKKRIMEYIESTNRRDKLLVWDTNDDEFDAFIASIVAEEYGNHEIVLCFWNHEFIAPIKEVELLIGEMNDANTVVIGSRFKRGSIRRSTTFSLSHFFHRIFSVLFSLLVFRNISDIQPPCLLVGLDVAKRIKICKPDNATFLNTALLWFAAKLKCKIRSVGIMWSS